MTETPARGTSCRASTELDHLPPLERMAAIAAIENQRMRKICRVKSWKITQEKPQETQVDQTQRILLALTLEPKSRNRLCSETGMSRRETDRALAHLVSEGAATTHPSIGVSGSRFTRGPFWHDLLDTQSTEATA